MLQPRYATEVQHRCSVFIEPRIPSLSEVYVRPLGPDDKAALRRFFEELSPTTVALRFLGPKKALSEKELSYFTEVDPVRHVALAATLGSGNAERIIGVARYVRLEVGGQLSERAEVAVTVADEFQGIGVGGMLTRGLILLAKQNGVREFVLNVSGENRKVLAMFRQYLRVVSHTVEAGAVEIVCSLDETPIPLARPEPPLNI